MFIHDSRPQLNAVSNRFKGGGYEDCGSGTNYPNCRLSFSDIENIHCVTGCYNKLFGLAYAAQPPKDG